MWPLAWTMLLMASVMTALEGKRSHPTRVPGSDHLVVQTEFPYAFWRASSRPSTPRVTTPHHTEAPSYPYFYGEAKDDPGNDPTTWQIMPIQIPNDLVSYSSQRTQLTTSQVPSYPTTPTPQYGRHPGVTDPPPLFHPERLYRARNESDNNRQPAGGSSTHQVHRYSNEESNVLRDSYSSYHAEYSKPPQKIGQTEKPEVSLPWHQSLSAAIDSHLSKLPALPKLPEWPLRGKQDKHKIQTDTLAEKSDTTSNDEHVVHKFYHIIPDVYTAYQETQTPGQNNIPNEPHREHSYSNNQFSVQNNPNYPNDHVLPTADNRNFTINQYSQSTNHNYQNGNSPFTEQIPSNNQPFSANRAGYEPHKHNSYTQDDRVESGQTDLTQSGPQATELYATDSEFDETWEQRRPNQNRPTRRHRRPGHPSPSYQGQQHKNIIKERPYTDQRWPSNDANHPLHELNSPIKSHLNLYRNRPQKPTRQRTNQASRPEFEQAFSSHAHPEQAFSSHAHPEQAFSSHAHPEQAFSSHAHPEQAFSSHAHPEQAFSSHAHPEQAFSSHAHPEQAFSSHAHPEPQVSRYPAHDMEEQHPRPAFLDPSIVDRLASLDPLSSTVVLPGGLLVVALALAVFYFNYVWYPTPVVTAKMVKVLLDAAPADIILVDQEKTIEDVYEVFRSLEATYAQDQNLWSPACKSRLVCQVHQELPDLWQVTQAYGTLVRSSLASNPEGDGDFNTYLQAAQQGTGDTTCSDHYPACAMPPVPVRASLQRLLGIVQDEYSDVVYS
nr:uncharacterized protein LOC123768856 [Procambarus clarkii]